MEELLAYLKEYCATQERLQWMREQRYDNPDHEGFALNRRTRRLGHRDLDPEFVDRLPLAVIAAVPEPPWQDVIANAEATIWEWLDPKKRRYEPDPDGAFLWSIPRPALSGIICEEKCSKEDRTVESYLFVERRGIIEAGLSERIRISQSGILYFRLVPLVGYLWQFLGFVTDFYQTFGLHSSFSLVVCLRATDGAALCTLAEGWREPTDGRHRPLCPEPNILLRRENLAGSMDAESIAKLVRGLATVLDNAWGERSPRCFVYSPEEEFPPFDRRRFLQFSRSW